jgi:hypothetical protein
MRDYRRMSLIMLLLTAVIYFFISLMLPDESFWITDGGNKFIVMKNIEIYGHDDISYPAREVDPDARFLPDSVYHLNKTPKGVFSIFPSYFPVISLPFYYLLDYAGLYILPFISSLVIFLYMFRLANRASLPCWQGGIILIAAFCSPLIFYSFTFWEMTPAIALSTIATFFLVRQRMHRNHLRHYMVAGLLLGLSAVLREEAYFLIAAFTATMLIMKIPLKRIFYMLVGFAIIILPLWAFQDIRYGHFLGLHGSGYLSHNAGNIGMLNVLTRQLGGYWVYLFQFNSWSINPQGYYILLAIPFILVICAGVYFRDYQMSSHKKRQYLLIMVSIAAAALVVGMFTKNNRVQSCIFMIGLLPSVPFLAFLFVGLRPLFKWTTHRARFMIIACCIYIVVLCPLLTQTDMGLIWGPRHFMVLLPMLIPLSTGAVRGLNRNCESFRIRQFYRICFLFLCFLGLVIQVRGIYNLKVVKDNTLKLTESVAKRTDTVIVSDIYWMPFMTPGLYHERKFMQVKNDNEFISLYKLLKLKRVEYFTLILAADPQFSALSRRLRLAYLGPKIKFMRPYKVSLPGTKFFEVLIVRCRIPMKKGFELLKKKPAPRDPRDLPLIPTPPAPKR